MEKNDNNHLNYLNFTDLEQLRKLFENLLEIEVIPEKYKNFLLDFETASQSLTKINDNLLSLINSSNDVLFRISKTGKLLFVSNSCENLLGITSDKIIGKSFQKFISAEKLNDYLKQFSELMKQNKSGPIQVNLLNKFGKEVQCSVTFKMSEVLGEKILQGSVHDIRINLEAEEKLKSSENTFKNTIPC